MKTYRAGNAGGEFQRIEQASQRADPHAELIYLHAEPVKVRAGMLVLADGEDWNPGSGVGLYRRSADNTEWLFVGDTTDVLTQAEEQLFMQLAVEQLRQLQKIALLLSAITGVVVDDSEIDAPTAYLSQLTKIALILSAVSGLSVDDNEIDLSIS